MALVSYLNAVPFRYGLACADAAPSFEVRLAVPSECAEMVRAGAVDIALLPLAELEGVRGYSVFSPFCIGARGPVRTVCLFANCPIGSVERIYLDGDSRTSARLVRYLAGARWGIAPSYAALATPTRPLGAGEAVVLIGDKVFAHEGRYAYRYDLAEAWVEHAGVPAVFAMWVIRDGLRASAAREAFCAGLAYGVSHIGESLTLYEGSLAQAAAYTYLTENIAYQVDLPMLRGAAALGGALWASNRGVRV